MSYDQLHRIYTQSWSTGVNQLNLLSIVKSGYQMIDQVYEKHPISTRKIETTTGPQLQLPSHTNYQPSSKEGWGADPVQSVTKMFDNLLHTSNQQILKPRLWQKSSTSTLTTSECAALCVRFISQKIFQIPIILQF